MMDSPTANLHARSLELADEFVTAYRNTTDVENVISLLEQYRDVRRRIPIDPLTGRRFGAEEAFLATQGLPA